MEPEGSSPHSQEPATCPYPEPYQSSFFNTLSYSYLYICLPLTAAFMSRYQTNATSAHRLHCSRMQAACNPFDIALLAYVQDMPFGYTPDNEEYQYWLRQVTVSSLYFLTHNRTTFLHRSRLFNYNSNAFGDDRSTVSRTCQSRNHKWRWSAIRLFTNTTYFLLASQNYQKIKS